MFLKGNMRLGLNIVFLFSKGRPSEGHNVGGAGGKAHRAALLGKRCGYHEATNGSVG